MEVEEAFTKARGIRWSFHLTNFMKASLWKRARLTDGNTPVSCYREDKSVKVQI
jgi:hypothetical protein